MESNDASSLRQTQEREKLTEWLRRAEQELRDVPWSDPRWEVYNRFAAAERRLELLIEEGGQRWDARQTQWLQRLASKSSPEGRAALETQAVLNAIRFGLGSGNEEPNIWLLNEKIAHVAGEDMHASKLPFRLSSDPYLFFLLGDVVYGYAMRVLRATGRQANEVSAVTLELARKWYALLRERGWALPPVPPFHEARGEGGDEKAQS